MTRTVLVTGGAGFIGSHLTDHLINHGYEVIVYDALIDQVHDGVPSYLHDDAKLVVGDLRDREALRNVLERADYVSHQASLVGIGQSMYDVERYVDVNATGTATLLDVIAKEDVSIEKLVLSSTMSIYGEGAGYCADCDAERYPSIRDADRLAAGEWEPTCPTCGAPLDLIPTPESAPPAPTSVYAITKKAQEELCHTLGRAYDVPTVALRYFSVYGSRQSLDNPYTGVCAIFTSRIKNGDPPIIFEDGHQVRDFVHVSDVARANRLALETSSVDGEIVNVGTGTPTSIRDIATELLSLYGSDLEPEVTEEYREGDIRDIYADTSEAESLLGFEAETTLSEGLRELAEWGASEVADDSFGDAYEGLQEHDLLDETE